MKFTREYFKLTQDVIIDKPTDVGLFVEGYISTNKLARSVLSIYERGVIIQKTDSKGKIVDNKVIIFDNVEGISSKETNISASGMYVSTKCEYSIIDRNGATLLKGFGVYSSKDIKGAEYNNFFGYAFNALLSYWNTFVSTRYREEFENKGYMTFITEKDVIRVGSDFLELCINQKETYFKDGETNVQVTTTIRNPFEHNIYNGCLTIISRDEIGHQCTNNINLNCMYNKIQFAIAFSILELRKSK